MIHQCYLILTNSQIPLNREYRKKNRKTGYSFRYVICPDTYLSVWGFFFVSFLFSFFSFTLFFCKIDCSMEVIWFNGSSDSVFYGGHLIQWVFRFSVLWRSSDSMGLQIQCSMGLQIQCSMEVFISSVLWRSSSSVFYGSSDSVVYLVTAEA
jgi:hypothetical protein